MCVNIPCSSNEHFLVIYFHIFFELLLALPLLYPLGSAVWCMASGLVLPSALSTAQSMTFLLATGHIRAQQSRAKQSETILHARTWLTCILCTRPKAQLIAVQFCMYVCVWECIYPVKFSEMSQWAFYCYFRNTWRGDFVNTLISRYHAVA